MFQILIIDNDKTSVKLTRTILKQAGFCIYEASTCANAFEVMDKQHIDLIVCETDLPEVSGFEFTERIRSVGSTIPILMLSSKTTSEDRCRGFISGADDFITKPFNNEELILRIKAILRRCNIANEHKLRLGDVILDYNSLTVTRGNSTQTLPHKEFKLLYKLLSTPEKIFTRMELMDEIWGMESNTVHTTVNVHINRLRKRFARWHEFEIISIRGVGYKAVIHKKTQNRP